MDVDPRYKPPNHIQIGHVILPDFDCFHTKVGPKLQKKCKTHHGCGQL